MHYQQDLQLIISAILTKEDELASKISLTFIFDFIYLWFLYREHKFIAANHSLVLYESLREKILDLLDKYNLSGRYTSFPQLLLQQGWFRYHDTYLRSSDKPPN